MVKLSSLGSILSVSWVKLEKLRYYAWEKYVVRTCTTRYFNRYNCGKKEKMLEVLFKVLGSLGFKNKFGSTDWIKIFLQNIGKTQMTKQFDILSWNCNTMYPQKSILNQKQFWHTIIGSKVKAV